MWGHHPVSDMNLYALQQASTAKPQESDDEGVYLGVGTKDSKDKQVKLKEGGGYNSRSDCVKGCGAKHEDGSSPLLMNHKSA